MQRRERAVVPTHLARHLRDTQDGLLVAAIVALHENSKVKLREAELFFQVKQTDQESVSSLNVKKFCMVCAFLLFSVYLFSVSGVV